MGEPLSTAAIVSLAVGGTAAAAGTAHSVDQSKAARRDSKRAAEAGREARAVSTASQENERQMAIKTQLRQERVRRAQLEVAAESTGVTGASSVTGQASANKAVVGAGQAFATGQSFANTAQSELLQTAADYNFDAQSHLAKGRQAQQIGNLGLQIGTTVAGVS